MSNELVRYTCRNCGHTVEFFAGFTMECKGRINNPSHAFTAPQSVVKGESLTVSEYLDATQES